MTTKWLELPQDVQKDQARYRAFAMDHVFPRANSADLEQRLSPEVFEKLAQEKFWGATVPEKDGGAELDALRLGLLHEALGAACTSLRAVLTTHHMVAGALARWGTAALKARWLPKLASGQTLAAFALTEPDIGSDASKVQTHLDVSGAGLIVTGTKKWITSGQVADLFLVIAEEEGKPAALIVPRDTEGLKISPITDTMGLRAGGLATVELDGCVVPEENRVAGPGFGFSHVATAALDVGRFTVAWGCIGLSRACLESSLAYGDERMQFGALLRDQPLIQRLLTDTIVEHDAARLLCLKAAALRSAGDPESVVQTLCAKYKAAQVAHRAADNAVQIHGAVGYSREAPVERLFRDARAMEIIEGSTQILQMAISKSFRGAF